MPDTDYGALAAALAKAQSSFPPIPRDKTVTVQTKAGSSYTFKYAPLDSILAAVRAPLAANGLAVAQLIDSDPDGQPVLVTNLMHSGGASLSGRTPIPQTDGVQAFGSAITYLRRYSLQAILGIAAEEDDDGNSAAGNTAKFGRPAPDHLPPREPVPPREGSLIGVAEAAKPPHDFEVRQSPDGPMIGFALKEGREIVRVIAYGQVAEEIAAFREAVEGKRIIAFGSMTAESWTMNAGTAKERNVPYTRLNLTRLTGPEGLALPMPTDAPTVPLFEDDPELDAALARVP